MGWVSYGWQGNWQCQQAEANAAALREPEANGSASRRPEEARRERLRR